MQTAARRNGSQRSMRWCTSRHAAGLSLINVLFKYSDYKRRIAITFPQSRFFLLSFSFHIFEQCMVIIVIAIVITTIMIIIMNVVITFTQSAIRIWLSYLLRKWTFSTQAHCLKPPGAHFCPQHEHIYKHNAFGCGKESIVFVIDSQSKTQLIVS